MSRHTVRVTGLPLAPSLTLLAALIGLTAAAGCGAAPSAPSSRYGDQEHGECRRDTDCATGMVCEGESMGHLRDADGEIVGDHISYACVPAPDAPTPPDAAPTVPDAAPPAP